VLYVANGGDGTVSRLDPQSGRPVGPPLPAGPAPAQLATGPGGTLLVLPAGGPAWRLTHLTPGAPAPHPGGAPPARAVPLESGGSGGGARLAGDGQGAAVLAYHVPAGTPAGRRLVGRLALLDVARGAVGRTYTVGADPDVVVDAALEPGPPEPVAYLAVWRPAALLDGRWRPAAGRILAVDALTGAGLGAAALSGPPVQLLLAQAPGDAGRRLYCLVGGPGAEADLGAEGDLVAGGPWRLLALDPLTLLPEREHTLPHPVRGLAIAPDGAAAFALDAAGRRAVVRLDLRTGTTRRLAALPGAGAALTVTRERVYVADGRGAVWALDARGGALVGTLAVGRGPVGLALSGPV
jgi:hypothetical protein